MLDASESSVTGGVLDASEVSVMSGVELASLGTTAASSLATVTTAGGAEPPPPPPTMGPLELVGNIFLGAVGVEVLALSEVEVPSTMPADAGVCAGASAKATALPWSLPSNSCLSCGLRPSRLEP